MVKASLIVEWSTIQTTIWMLDKKLSANQMVIWIPDNFVRYSDAIWIPNCYRASEYQTPKCPLFEWFHYLNVRYSDPHCISNVFLGVIFKVRVAFHVFMEPKGLCFLPGLTPAYALDNNFTMMMVPRRQPLNRHRCLHRRSKSRSGKRSFPFVSCLFYLKRKRKIWVFVNYSCSRLTRWPWTTL